MALAPKTKLWVGTGVFTLFVLGLLSLNSDTFSGNLSLIPRANPALCEALKKACDASDGTVVACLNYKKIMCEELATATEAQAIKKAPDEEPVAPRPRARMRNAAPQPSDNAETAPQASPDQSELDAMLNEFPEGESQGPTDTNELR